MANPAASAPESIAATLIALLRHTQERYRAEPVPTSKSTSALSAMANTSAT